MPDAALCRRHADERSPSCSQVELGGALHKVVAHAECIDERGYDTFWMAEHHFQPERTELIPNVLIMALHLCGATKNLRIDCGFNIVPMWYPLRLAEDYAMADILTGGRVIFGIGRGILDRVAPARPFTKGDRSRSDSSAQGKLNIVTQPRFHDRHGRP